MEGLFEREALKLLDYFFYASPFIDLVQSVRPLAPPSQPSNRHS